jgi:predicted phosphodiesterase
MKPIALISDIHANIDALEAVLDDIDRQEIGEILCLGDVVGYGAAPAECVKLIRTRCPDLRS